MGSYQEAFANLNDAQRKAVSTTEGPVLVIAGPGTGKTQLLTTRIAHILTVTDTLPENILCLTFTDAAAQNMRERLSSMIGQAAYNITISTYHAFGSDLIRRYPEHFAKEGDLEPVDDLSIDTIFRTILSKQPHNSPLAHADMYLRDVISFVSDAKRALLSPQDIRRTASANTAYAEQVQPLLNETVSSVLRISKKVVPNFQALADALPTVNKSEAIIQPIGILFAQELYEALALVEETGKPTHLTTWKNKWLVRDGQGNFALNCLASSRKLLALADVYEQYLSHLQQQNLFDYDDMILRAIKGMSENDDLRFTLQEQYLYILLDEFQDTNGAQLRLVELLTNNPVLEGRPNVLAVGDDDQAIYAFQGADYSHMLQFKDLYRDVVVVPLTENYRSHADILHTARGIAEQVEERLHHHFPDIEKELIAANKNLPERAIVERYEAASDSTQFAWIAEKIRALLDSGTPAHEIAVLAPQHKYLEPLIPFLKEKDIPVRYDKRENVLDDPAIVQLERMAQLCLLISQKKPAEVNALWCEVLSFSFWQLPTSLIWQLSWQATDDNKGWIELFLEKPELKPIGLFFMRLSQVTAYETLETMLDYLIGTTPLALEDDEISGYTSPFFAHYFGEQPRSTEFGAFWDLLTNLTVLRSRLRDYKRHDDEPLLLADFLQFTHEHRTAGIKILNTSPYQDSDHAVQLMTAFKSKGQEFGAVFLVSVSNEAWGAQARGRSNHISLPPNLSFIRYAGATNDERLRLFYVALTRARTQLYIVNYKATFSGKQVNRLQYLQETTEDGKGVSPLLPTTSQAIHEVSAEGIDNRLLELQTYWQQRHERALRHPQIKKVLQPRLSKFQLSPTHVNAFTDLEHAGPFSFFMDTILRFPTAPSPQGQFGNAMHETLEWLHLQLKRTGTLPGLTDTLAVFDKRLSAKRLSQQDTTLMQARGHDSLQAFLIQRRHTLSASDEVEFNFRNLGIFIGDAHMTGKIDKLIVNKQEKTVAIVDYKTGKSSTKWEAKIKLHKYQRQLYLYKALVELSRPFAGYTVTDAYLEFVEPDDEGNINQLHLTFNNHDYEQAKAMAEAVWKHVQDVSIPDVTEYSADYKGTLAFEQFLLTDKQ